MLVRLRPIIFCLLTLSTCVLQAVLDVGNGFFAASTLDLKFLQEALTGSGRYGYWVGLRGLKADRVKELQQMMESDDAMRQLVADANGHPRSLELMYLAYSGGRLIGSSFAEKRIAFFAHADVQALLTLGFPPSLSRVMLIKALRGTFVSAADPEVSEAILTGVLQNSLNNPDLFQPQISPLFVHKFAQQLPDHSPLRSAVLSLMSFDKMDSTPLQEAVLAAAFHARRVAHTTSDDGVGTRPWDTTLDQFIGPVIPGSKQPGQDAITVEPVDEAHRKVVKTDPGQGDFGALAVSSPSTFERPGTFLMGATTNRSVYVAQLLHGDWFSLCLHDLARLVR